MQHTTLINALYGTHGATFIGLDTLTDVKLAGGMKNPQQGRVQKRVYDSNVMVFQNKNINGYEAMVRRRLIAEGKNPDSFELSPRTWGVRIPDMPLVEHTVNGVTKYYLEVIFLKAGTVDYLIDGKLAKKAEIIGLPATPEPKQGGLDNTVIVRCYAVDSIACIRVNGAEWH